MAIKPGFGIGGLGLGLALCGIAAAQHLSLGVIGGVRLNGDLEGRARSESQRYVIGPSLEIGLPARFAFEANALYRRVGYRSDFSDPLGSSFFTRSRANSWEFPLLLKRRLPLGLFVSGGYAPRTVQFTDESGGVQVNSAGNRTTVPASSYAWPRQTSHGGVIGAGIVRGWRHLRFAPEFRYTRWNNRALEIEGSRGYRVLWRQDQAEVLVGIHWGSEQ